jgi:uncharacterized membrane protein
MTTRNRASVSEVVTFAVAGLCLVLGIVVAPMAGGATWVVLAVAALLAWQGVTLRRRRLLAGPPSTA